MGDFDAAARPITQDECKRPGEDCPLSGCQSGGGSGADMVIDRNGKGGQGSDGAGKQSRVLNIGGHFGKTTA